MNLLDDLNPAQRAAVEYTDGPQLVVAGAGSGKTRVITYKVAHLITTGRFAAEHILAVTFTNKAADEMRERIHALLEPGRSATPTVCTFHSFCARFLRQEIGVLGFSSNYTICDADDQARLVKDILKELHIAEPPVSVDMIVGRIGRAKIHAIAPAHYAARFRDADADLLGEIFGRYERRLTASGALDFEDLILKSNEILERFPNIRARLAQRYRYLLVDEFQDTNPPQYKLVQLLGGEHRNLCVVGDEDQSIYGFRGAILANILNFERDFPGAKLFKLEQNYRSTRAILRAASGLVAHNRQRREKSLWTDNVEGEPVVLYRAGDPKEEANWVARAVKDVLLNDFTGSVGILYRANFQSRRVEDGLKGLAIAYRVVGGQAFYSRKEIKDLVAYLKLAFNRRDDAAFLRVVNAPPRGLGDRAMELLRRQAVARGNDLWGALEDILVDESMPTRLRTAFRLFHDLIQLLARSAAEKPLGEFIEQLVIQSGYQKYLSQQSDPESQSRLENTQEFITAAREHQQEGGTVQSFLDRAALVSDAETVAGSGRVTLMTLHGAKGLEFDHVFLVGVEQGLLPHHRSQETDEDIEEERRLCYVGMTRARKRLALSHSWSRPTPDGSRTDPVRPSMFLDEIPADALLELPRYTPFPLTAAGVRPVRLRTKLKDRGFRTLDTAAEIQAFFGKSGGARAADPKAGPRIVHRVTPRADGAAPSAAGKPKPAAKPGARAAAGWKLGDRVVHPTFGRGTIQRIDNTANGRKLTIYFERFGLRRLMDHLADLERG